MQNSETQLLTESLKLNQSDHRFLINSLTKALFLTADQCSKVTTRVLVLPNVFH